MGTTTDVKYNKIREGLKYQNRRGVLEEGVGSGEDTGFGWVWGVEDGQKAHSKL